MAKPGWEGLTVSMLDIGSRRSGKKSIYKVADSLNHERNKHSTSGLKLQTWSPHSLPQASRWLPLFKEPL